jgi:hypothetical protein
MPPTIGTRIQIEVMYTCTHLIQKNNKVQILALIFSKGEISTQYMKMILELYCKE